MPQWMRQIGETTIYVGENKIVEFGQPINRYEETLKVEIQSKLIDEDIITYHVLSNRLTIDGSLLTEQYVGYWKFTMTATEVKLDQAYTYEKIFYFRVTKKLTDELVDPTDPVDPVNPVEDNRQG